MLRKKIKYEDLNGVNREEVFDFNLTEAELIRLQNEVPGGFDSMLEGIAKAENAPAVYRELERIIGVSYGLATDDGRNIDKNPKHFELFQTSPAYAALIMDLFDTEGALENFLDSIMPPKWMAEVERLKKEHGSYDKAIEVIKEEKREIR